MSSEQCTVIQSYFWTDKYKYTSESVEVFSGNNFKLYSLSRQIWRSFAALSMTKWKYLVATDQQLCCIWKFWAYAAWQILWAPKVEITFLCPAHAYGSEGLLKMQRWQSQGQCPAAASTSPKTVPCIKLAQQQQLCHNRQIDLCGPADMSIQWLYLKQSMLCYAVSVSTLFSWAGRPYQHFLFWYSSYFSFLTSFFMPLSCFIGA